VSKNFLRTIYIYGDFFWEFYNSQTETVQEKIDWVIDLIKTVRIVPEKFLKHMEGTNGLYEIRVKVGSDIYRIFCFFGKRYLVILLNAFQKKSDRTPKQEIERAELLKSNTMTTKKRNKLVSWESHLDKKYGKIGTPKRNKYEEEFETFKIGALIQEARIHQHLTQEELALKVGTTKNYISRIENDASDIRLSTLIRIIREGLGGHLKLTFD
jgi:HTH-type transcriptional regulator / antitoxin HipB